jgi:hypothetical protein
MTDGQHEFVLGGIEDQKRSTKIIRNDSTFSRQHWRGVNLLNGVPQFDLAPVGATSDPFRTAS